MFSPSFECSLAGLRSAVRLRYTLTGAPDPEAAAARYMVGASRLSDDPAALRQRIQLVIWDIERISLSLH